MKSYSTAFAFRRALEDRLNTASKAEGVDLQRMRRQVAFYRLLVRLFTEGTVRWFWHQLGMMVLGGYGSEAAETLAQPRKWEIRAYLTACL
jgi:hypothetical protein